MVITPDSGYWRSKPHRVSPALSDSLVRAGNCRATEVRLDPREERRLLDYGYGVSALVEAYRELRIAVAR
jgi:hypothetical protein